MHTLIPKFQRLLDFENERHEKALLEIVDSRLASFARDWKRTRTTPVKLIFGMGTMAAEGNFSDRYYGNRWPTILEELDMDLDEICNGYRSACPDNFEVIP